MKTNSIALCVALLEQISEGIGALSDAFDANGPSDVGSVLGQYSEHIEAATATLRMVIKNEESTDDLVRN